jgi:TonB family protein
MVGHRVSPELKWFAGSMLLLGVFLGSLALWRLWRFETISASDLKRAALHPPLAVERSDIRWAPPTKWEGSRPPGSVVGLFGVLSDGVAPGNVGYGRGTLFRRADPEGGLAPGSGWSYGPAPPPPPPPPHARKPDNVKRIKLTENFARANLIRRPEPKYPALARQARIQGTVKLEIEIGRDGKVQEARLLEGHPLLVPAAIDAVMQWLFKPTLLNGEPVRVQAPITIVFTLR